jgi:NitT/TauT family transport system permease protein
LAAELIPYLLGRSLIRMTAAYFVSLAFSLTYGIAAASSPRLERLLIPLLDVLESVPVLGFFPVALFLLVPAGGGLGAEVAAVFLIFTSQAWNMAFSVYESTRLIPEDLWTVVRAFGLSRGQVLVKLVIPATVPKLVYNSMMSWAGGWYFLIASEIITLGNRRVELPGIGSFLMDTASSGRLQLTALGLGCLVALIVAMDLAIWRPAQAWAQRFAYDVEPSAVRHPRRWKELAWLPRISWRRLSETLRITLARLAPLSLAAHLLLRALALVAAGLLTYLTARLAVDLASLLIPPWPQSALQIPFAVLASAARLVVAYTLSLAWTLPVSIWAVGSEKRLRLLLPLLEIGASVPATAIFPFLVLAVIRLGGGADLPAILLIMTGMQWYLAFNILGGLRAVPADLSEALDSFGVRGLLRLRRFTLPAILPSLITGSITGWGGGWNSLVVAEYISFSGSTYVAFGIGSLLSQATYTGEGKLMALSLISLVAVVVAINLLLWQRLYRLAAARFSMAA